MTEPHEFRGDEEQKGMAEPQKSRQEGIAKPQECRQEEEQKIMTQPQETSEAKPQESRQEEEQKDIAEPQECSKMEEEKDMGKLPRTEEQTRANVSKKRGREDATADESPGQNAFRLLVPNSMVGCIIGRGGENIDKLRKETRSRIRILDGGSRDRSCSERVVLVSATEQPDAPISPAMAGILKLHRLIIGLPAILDHSQGSGQVVQRSNPSQQPGGDRQLTITRMLIGGDSQASSIIGKRGSTIKEIQGKSGATARILTRPEDTPRECALAGDKVLEIRGEPAQVHKALEQVVSHLRKFVYNSSFLPSFENNIMSKRTNQSTTASHMEEQHHGQHQPRNNPTASTSLLATNIIGSSQSSTQIGNQYCTYTSPPGHGGSYYDPPISAHEIRPVGTHDQYSHQHSSYVREAPHGSSSFSAPPANPPPAPHATNNIQRLRQVPLNYMDFVIGENGENIRYCRRTSGAIIHVYETTGVPGQVTIDIRGSMTEVHIAQQLIDNLIARGDSEPSAPQPEEYVAQSGQNVVQHEGGNQNNM